jgi:translation initiation factor 3 subunit M
VCDAALKHHGEQGQQSQNLEEVLNGIVSMLSVVTGEKSENLILAFCEKLSKAPSNDVGLVCLKV